MISPVDALSLAAAVLQFVEFGSKLVVEGYGMYKSKKGATEQNLHIESVAAELNSICEELSLIPDPEPTNANSNVTAIVELANNSQSLARELLDLLDELKEKSTGPFRTWETIRKSIKNSNASNRISALQKKLSQIKKELDLRLLALIRFELGNLSRQSKEWHLTQLEALNKTKRELFAAVEQQGKAFDLAIKKHRELKISATQAYEARLDDVVGKITNVLHEFKKLQKADSILGSLLFPEIHVRHSKISEAHMNTFACIFEQDVTPFKTWLQCSNEVFWINGKAGSGKSTLVKYVADHPRTETILRQWANGVKLVTVSYYFWSSGHPMQRSQEGLLQSLLFQLLCHFPDAIPVVAGSRWETDDFGVKNSVPWTRKELTAGIRFVLAQERLPARFCFFIDGLDEYSGDHTALIDDLDLLAASDTVKLCVSSRPWNAFRDAYGEAKDCQLVLEDLTKSDMSKYIKDVLEDDNRFKRLSKKESQAQIFAEEIQDKANGVFLWVILAVRSLLRGLTEHDSVEELAERLKDIPKDLETFFQRILDSVEDFYKSYMARALLLTLYAAESLPLLSFWCLQKEPPSPSGSQARVGLQCPSRSMASS